MSTHTTRLMVRVLAVTIRRILVAGFMVLAMALLVLSPSANAADQVAVNDKVKDSIVQIGITYTAWVQIPGQYMESGQPDWKKTASRVQLYRFRGGLDRFHRNGGALCREHLRGPQIRTSSEDVCGCRRSRGPE